MTRNVRASSQSLWEVLSGSTRGFISSRIAGVPSQGSVPIWVTEYGHQTRPPDSFGVSYATQARYIRQSIALARRLDFVEMFIWFVYQDDPGQPWDSGLYTQTGARKGSSARRFETAARPLDARNTVLSLRRGTRSPQVTLFTRRFCVVDAPGDTIGVTWRARVSGRLVAVGQQAPSLKQNCTVDVRLDRFRIAKRTYVVTLDLEDINGEKLTRRVTIRGK